MKKATNLKKINELRGKLKELNKAYREGNPQVSDSEYDSMEESLRKLSPDDEFFKKGVAEEATDRMEKLPMPMFSLEKVKVVKDLRKWLEKMMSNGCEEIIITPKFDGISLLVSREGGVWTRGDGYEGQRSDIHFKKMEPRFSVGFEYVWGEAIMSKKNFQELKESAKDFSYKNARNMVAGIFNSPEGHKNIYINKVDFVQYGTSAESKYNKDIQLDMLCGNKADYILFPIEEILELSDEEIETLLNEEVYPKLNGEYKIDGIVIEVNEYAVRNQLGRLPNGNPAYSIAYKRPEWVDTYQTKVLGIEYGIGKTGALNPVILIEPVEMDGATVSRATAYNAAYLVDNHICKGALIEITRSGDVIPKHLDTISYDEGEYEQMMDDMIFCPSCGEPLKWNETHVDLVCSNESCRERVISGMVYFFRTMGCEQFEEPTIRRLYGHGYKTIDTILESHVSEFQNLLGKSKGKTVFSQIEKVLAGTPLARYLTAINVFDGKIAEATCQKILDGLNGEMVERLRDPNSYALTAESAVALKHECELIPGIGDVLALTFVKGLKTYLSRGKDKRIVITYVQSPKVETPEGGFKKVCLTGFRDKELEKMLPQFGYVVSNGVSKDLYLLVTADMNSSSSKMKKASEYGIKIISRKDFEDMIK